MGGGPVLAAAAVGGDLCWTLGRLGLPTTSSDSLGPSNRAVWETVFSTNLSCLSVGLADDVSSFKWRKYIERYTTMDLLSGLGFTSTV